MRLTPFVRAIVNDWKRGGKKWIETTAKELPPGYRKFHYSPWYFGALTATLGFASYYAIHVQSHPDSWYGRIFDNFWDYVTYDFEKGIAVADEKEREREKRKDEGPSAVSRVTASLANSIRRLTTFGTVYPESKE